MRMAKDKKAEKMEKHLLKTQFPKECEELPFDKLDAEEQEVVTKCINHEELSDDEFSLLKMTLQKYREHIRKHKPSETVEAYENTEQMILTEKDWLALVNDKSARMLKVNVPLNGKWYPMEFEILPLDDSSVVPALQTHVDLFKDYNRDELQAWTKSQQGYEISPEEQQIVDKITKEIEDKQSENRISSMNTFLAAQLRLPNSSSDVEVRKEFWVNFPFIVKSAIMFKVEDRLGLTDQQDEKLFPTS